MTGRPPDFPPFTPARVIHVLALVTYQTDRPPWAVGPFVRITSKFRQRGGANLDFALPPAVVFPDPVP